MGQPTVGSNPTLSAKTDTVIDTIVSVTVSAFLCPFYRKQGVFLTLQRTFDLCLHDDVVSLGVVIR